MADRKCAGRLIAGVLCAGLAFWSFGTGPAAGILAYAGLTAYGAESDAEAGAERKSVTDTKEDAASEAGAETALLLHPTIRRYFRYASGQQGGEERLARIDAVRRRVAGPLQALARRGKEVVSLKRLTMGPLTLDETLAPGDWRPLTEAERARLPVSG